MPDKSIASSDKKNSRNEEKLLEGQCTFTYTVFLLEGMTRFQEPITLGNEKG